MDNIYEEGCTPGTTGTAPAGATPGNTMGMGNPMAPTGDENGSGDIPTAKIKKKRKSLKDHIKEGLFDMDADIETSKVDSILKDKAIETINKILADKRVSKDEYAKAYNALKGYCVQYGEKWERDSRSLLRKKDKTVVIFLPDMPKKAEYQVLEIRRFVKNPLPYVLTIWSSGQDYVVYRIKPQNHPQSPQEFKLREEMYVMPGDFWTDFDVPYSYRL